MPSTSGCPDHISLARRRGAVVGVDVTRALEDDEELVGVAMEMPVVAGARRQHGPAEQEVVGAGLCLVDEELHLHVDPALVAAQPADEGNLRQIRVEAIGHCAPPESM